MVQVSVAERTKLSVLWLRGSLRRFAGRIHGNPILNLSFLPAKTDRLLIAPQDLRTADATRAAEIYSGRFVFAGKVVICDARSPFELAPPSDEWAAELFGFSWLRHLRAADSGITRANARALVDEWITLQGSCDEMAWHPDLVARRIISWLAHSTLMLQDSEVRFYRRFLRSLAAQVRYLRHTAANARDGVPRLQAQIALTYAALCMQGQARHIRNATKKLVEELERQVLPDGGHVSRNPEALIELLPDLLPLRQVFSSRNVAPPAGLLNAVDRMMPMLRFFRHGDGNFGLFNGMGPTPPDLLSTVLAYDDARGSPVANAPHSGYQRLEASGAVLLMDTGRLPPVSVSQEAHAGFLAFEFSSKHNRIVVNCGLPTTGRDNWRQVARATAAHSTVTFNDTSSCRFLDTPSFRRMFMGVAATGGPSQVEVRREDHGEAVVLRTAHDGYTERFGIIHQRAIMLANDGNRLDGEDAFVTPYEGQLPSATLDAFAARFHLHPSVKASRLTDGHGAMLMMPNREVWTFNAYEDRVELEESVYLAGPDGPRRTVQLVVYGRARRVPRIHWTFLYTPAAAGTRRERGEEPELPL